MGGEAQLHEILASWDEHSCDPPGAIPGAATGNLDATMTIEAAAVIGSGVKAAGAAAQRVVLKETIAVEVAAPRTKDVANVQASTSVKRWVSCLQGVTMFEVLFKFKLIFLSIFTVIVCSSQ